jgi:hypothetical protein
MGSLLTEHTENKLAAVPNIAFAGHSTPDGDYMHVLEKNNPTSHNTSNERIPCSITLLELPQGSQLANSYQCFLEPNGTSPFLKTPLPDDIMSQTNPIHNCPLHIFIFISLLSSHPCLCLPNGLFPAGCQLKTLSYPCYMLHLPHLRIMYLLQYGK